MFGLSIGYNGEFYIFNKKKNVTNWKLKISKIPNVCLFGTLVRKFRTSENTFGAIEGEVEFESFTPIEFHVNEREIY